VWAFDLAPGTGALRDVVDRTITYRGPPSSSSRSSRPACAFALLSCCGSRHPPGEKNACQDDEHKTRNDGYPSVEVARVHSSPFLWLDAWIQIAFCLGPRKPWPAPGMLEVEVGVEGTGLCARLAPTSALAGLGGAPGAPAARMKPGQQPVTDHPRFRGGEILTSHARNNSTSGFHLIIHQSRVGSMVLSGNISAAPTAVSPSITR
jgi:hypothetical protein